MKRTLLVLVVTLLAASVVLGPAANARAKEPPKILEFDTMVGVAAPFTRGSGNAIRGVDGGGVPWDIEEGEGKLHADGDIEVKVEGLVITSTGVNPIASFKAIVSCLSKDTNGLKVEVNVSTGLFTASQSGDAEIVDHVDLPQPCIAPIIFVTSPGGAWFAATGF